MSNQPGSALEQTGKPKVEFDPLLQASPLPEGCSTKFKGNVRLFGDNRPRDDGAKKGTPPKK